MVFPKNKPTSQVIDSYLEEIEKSTPLSPEQECTLARRIKAGDQEARNQLVQANLRFVVSVAVKYKDQGVPLADLISAGNLGLIIAAERFDETRGLKFITYAVWWIRQHIYQALSDDTHLIRLPLNRQILIRQIEQHQQNNQNQECPLSTHQEIAQILQVTEAHVEDVLTTMPSFYSLDKPVYDGNQTLIDILPDQNQKATDEDAMHNATKRALYDLIKILNAREQEIIKLYFGLDGTHWTLQDIANKFDLTRERIRQIKDASLQKLKHHIHHRNLQPKQAS